MPDGQNPLPTKLSDGVSAERIGRSALEALDHIREEFEDQEDAQLEMVMVIALVRHMDEDDEEATAATYWCEDDRRFVHLGILRAATLGAEGWAE